MSLIAQAIGIAALLPAMTGPVSLSDSDTGAALHLALCAGGSIIIPLDPKGVPLAPNTVCCAKGCQRRSGRKIIDPEQ